MKNFTLFRSLAFVVALLFVGTAFAQGTGESEEKAYSVAEAQAAYVDGQKQTVWVKGYIVGYVDGGSLKDGSRFDLTGDSVSASNILLADSKEETDYQKCIPVQLKSGTDFRAAVNLNDNPQNLGKELALQASLEKYFLVAGLKAPVTEYTIDGESASVDPSPSENVIFESSFDNGDVAGFEFKDVEKGELDYVWKADSYGYLKASAYANKTNNAAESWAVSPAIDLSKVTKATLSFRHVLNYLNSGTAADHIKVFASTDYAGDVVTATWTELTIATYPSGSNWTFVDAGDIDLSAYCGKKVYIAFKYVSTADVAPTWEVDNMKVVAPAESGISSVENAENAPVEVYTLNGVKVGSSLDGLKSGIYLVKKGNKVQKVLK